MLSTLVLFDAVHPGGGDVETYIPIYVVGMKSYLQGLFKSPCVPMFCRVDASDSRPIWLVTFRPRMIGHGRELCVPVFDISFVLC